MVDLITFRPHPRLRGSGYLDNHRVWLCVVLFAVKGTRPTEQIVA
jgi:hypothetical protein